MTKNEIAAKLNNINDIQALTAEIDAAADDAAVLEILRQHNLDLTAEDIRALIDGDEGELDEDSLDDVSGGCKCKGPLKRWITNFLGWVVKTATGNKFTCLDCND